MSDIEVVGQKYDEGKDRWDLLELDLVSDFENVPRDDPQELCFKSAVHRAIRELEIGDYVGAYYKLEYHFYGVQPGHSNHNSVVRALTFGAKKYPPEEHGRHNWKAVKDGPHRYFAACKRHLIAMLRGELVAQDSGLHHVDHALCNLYFLNYFDKHAPSR